MKKFYTILVLVFVVAKSSAQIVNIPDANFKAKLLAASPTVSIALNSSGVRIKIDSNNDGNIQVSEAVLVHTLNVYQSNISDITGIQSFINLRNFSCDFNPITVLNLTGLTNLRSLNFSNCQLTSVDLTAFSLINTLNCQYNQLTTLNVSGLTAMTNMNCLGNQISSLNLSGMTNLTILYCGNNSLTSLDVSSLVNLTELNCSNNQISALNLTDLIDLYKIDFSNNLISNIDFQTNTSMGLIYGRNNLLTSTNLNGLSSLTYLDLSENEFSSLNFSALNSLQTLNLYNNSISNLNLPISPSLRSLNVGNNQLSVLNLDDYPLLYGLNCSGNQLTSLDISNKPLLNNLYCQNNLLTTLNLNNLNNLVIIKCNNNPLLDKLFVKTTTTIASWDLDISGNPSLSYICTDENKLLLFQNAILNNGYTCEVNTYCSFNPSGVFFTITGNNRFDFNNNGCDINDIDFSFLKFNITNGTISGSSFCNTTGGYFLSVQSGTHTITPVLENPNYFAVSPASASVSFPSATSPFTQDFCVTANGIFNDVEIIIIPIEVARPGFDAKYKIIYKNKGNQVVNGSLSFTFDDAIMDLVSATPVNDGNATNSLSWNYTNLNPFETREIDLIFNINSPTEIPAVNGDDVLDYTASIIGATDETPNDNTFTLNQTVVNSFDPNDKTCLEGTTITPSMVGQYVHYVIRFENTGTFAAQNIVVKDMIDTTKFDIATLVPQRSSHDFITRISNTNKVEFIFENINLPFDDANNDGYVAFKIRTKPTLVLGDTFSNEASIYFDYNFPIITEPAVTTVAALSNQDFDFGTYFTLYPNPAKEVLNFEVKNEIGVKSIQVYNTLGQIVLAVTNASTTRSVDVANLNAGAYFIKVTTDKGSANSKFIKE